ncbi:MAG: PilZ domain-containing protein [Methylococcales bacterium]
MHRSMAGNERRQFHRIVFEAPVLLSNGQRTWPVQLIDLSLRGCLLNVPKDWTDQADTGYRLTVQLSDSTEIRMNLTLARRTPDQIGFQCTGIDLHSICELRRLVELNLGDSTLLERDLNSLTAA